MKIMNFNSAKIYFQLLDSVLFLVLKLLDSHILSPCYFQYPSVGRNLTKIYEDSVAAERKNVHLLFHFVLRILYKNNTPMSTQHATLPFIQSVQISVWFSRSVIVKLLHFVLNIVGCKPYFIIYYGTFNEALVTIPLQLALLNGN